MEKLARSSHEALLYLDLTPCFCGGRRFRMSSVLVESGRRYTRSCNTCGVEQEFTFRLPAVPFESADFAYGGAEPSELVDAAQWLWVSDLYARKVPANPERLTGDELRKARGQLAAATAAIDEVLKFVPPGEERVPRSAVWTTMGEGLLPGEGERLGAARLGAVRAAYAKILAIMPAG